ncbi:Calcium-binding protein 39-like [Trichoplax sp. H2]|uniref:Uncharacterized protein n=1 Tax=Trichoplax adhaerens TaxID=10228 RepID=B3RI56_TRIAD|nr:hypothetical protein TRIADDRAFT_63161 [Trichoplax adhaerens]EDV29211.1 hypothetical protein TRIADDRAFT_63161 [Trichoplax adhaerens]RDD39141.1 Calcium-binding protein 39-like [Trichoplax sp. H2]|eukprot:XP_002108413.1 hypothetical protein TRIADDRAFT_63161 [Trichoplax adhaerens]
MPLFGSKQKSPYELVRISRDALATIIKEGSGKKAEKATDEIGKQLVAMKNILCGVGDQEPQTEQVAQLAQEIYNFDLLLFLVNHLHRLEFEAKKDVVQIFNILLRRQIGTRSPTVEYVRSKNEILFTLIQGYENSDIALNCGIILRECVKYDILAKFILSSDAFYQFFTYVELSAFDVASDAFSTFKDLLTKHKTLCAEFIEKNYDKLFEHYVKLLTSENYVTKRQSLKLLGEILLDHHNFSSMTKYVGNTENLKLIMNLLKDKSRNIQFEAFHVFKVFVANPNKAKPIIDILFKNKEKLLTFLPKFQTDRTDDEQFMDEKSYLITEITKLQKP